MLLLLLTSPNSKHKNQIWQKKYRASHGPNWFDLKQHWNRWNTVFHLEKTNSCICTVTTVLLQRVFPHAGPNATKCSLQLEGRDPMKFLDQTVWRCKRGYLIWNQPKVACIAPTMAIQHSIFDDGSQELSRKSPVQKTPAKDRALLFYHFLLAISRCQGLYPVE